MSLYKRACARESRRGLASRRGNRRRGEVAKARRDATRAAPSVSLIITACVPAKITPFIHPRRTTRRRYRLPRRLLPAFFPDSSLRRPSPPPALCHAASLRAVSRSPPPSLLFIRHCVFAELHRATPLFAPPPPPRNDNL